MAVVKMKTWRERLPLNKVKEKDVRAGYPLRELELSVRAERILMELGCSTISDVLHVTLRDLDNARGCGRKTVAEITQTLGKYGYALKG
jgi:DNA-directed RNA polymerase alpha subunit